MASEQHIELSTYIKNIHSDLRAKSKEIGYETAWRNHCEDTQILDKYAQSMKKLATEVWDKSEEAKTNSRIEWVYNYCQTYFTNGELQRQRKREIDIIGEPTTYDSTYPSGAQLKLLDVGSCYNPFKKYERFDVVAIDIAPGCPDVHKCDFLNLRIDDPPSIINKKQPFDVVVFSLLLEYLPSPELRLKCCENAYDLLKPEGVLLVITPDSKHVGANAKYMKSWRYALSLIGFSRVKYEKLPYLHCMTFRRCLHREFAQRWADLNKDKNISDVINIPQDFPQKSNDAD